MNGDVVGVRTERHAPLRFVRSAIPNLELMTLVVVEISGASKLAYVALPAESIVEVADDAVSGWVVAAGTADDIVRQSVEALDIEGLVVARRLPPTGVTVLAPTCAAHAAPPALALETPSDKPTP